MPPFPTDAAISVGAWLVFVAVAIAYADERTSRRISRRMVHIYRAIRYGREPAASKVGP